LPLSPIDRDILAQTGSAHVVLRHPFRLDIGREWSIVRGMRNASKNAAQSVATADIAAEIERLSDLSLGDLRAAWAAEFHRDPPKGLWLTKMQAGCYVAMQYKCLTALA
jgi:hypothetical protein